MLSVMKCIFFSRSIIHQITFAVPQSLAECQFPLIYSSQAGFFYIQDRLKLRALNPIVDCTTYPTKFKPKNGLVVKNQWQSDYTPALFQKSSTLLDFSDHAITGIYKLISHYALKLTQSQPCFFHVDLESSYMCTYMLGICIAKGKDMAASTHIDSQSTQLFFAGSLPGISWRY